MIGLLLYYQINTTISIVLASFVFYLILFQSPKNMTSFKWHLLNVQASTFVETFYWCFLSAPVPLNYPFFHTYSTGILSRFIPCDVQVGIAIFLLGKIIGALCIALVFRYHALMPRSDIPWKQSLIRFLPSFSIILGYGNGFLYGFLTYMSFLNKEETSEKLNQTDPLYVVPPGAVSIGGSWIYSWAILVISGYILGTVLCFLIGQHSWKILNAQRSRSQNREVFKSVAIQASTFVETFYWCFLSAPDPLSYPFFHIYSTGILSSFIPSDAQVGIAIFLLGKIIGALAIALVFRYRVLMPHSDTPWMQLFIRILPSFCIILGYGNGFLYGYLTYMTLSNKDETKKQLHQVRQFEETSTLQTDPQYVIPQGAVSIDESWIYTFALTVIFGYLLGFIICLMIGHHSWKILNAQRSRLQNREVFKSLVLQISVLYGIIVIPCTIIPGYLMFQSKGHTPFVGDTIFACGAAVYSLKSIAASVLICYTIRPYREFVIRFYQPKRSSNTGAVISITR